jgi:hypothetical protein
MMVSRTVLAAAIGALALAAAAEAQVGKTAPLYNTALQKIKDGKQVLCSTVSSPDPDAYCAVATPQPIAPGSRCSTAP